MTTLLMLPLPQSRWEFWDLVSQSSLLSSVSCSTKDKLWSLWLPHWEIRRSPLPIKLHSKKTPPKRKLQRRTASQHTVEWLHLGVLLRNVVHKDTWASKSDRHGPVPSWLWDLGMLLCTFSLWSRDYRAESVQIWPLSRFYAFTFLEKKTLFILSFR